MQQASKPIVDHAEIQKRILTFVNVANWVLFSVLVVGGMLVAGSKIFLGILFGGLIVTVNFHLLARTLKNSLTPPFLKSHNSILAKYYVRFTISGLIIFVLISEHIVHPIGLFIGLSVVVASIMLATVCEITKLFCCKEAV